MKRILVIGAAGSIGQNLISELIKTHGKHSVIAALHRSPLPDHLASDVICEFGFNIRDNQSIRAVFERHADSIDSVWNLAAPLSVDTAKDPSSAHDVTVGGMQRVLACMKEFNIKKLYFSDSIGSYGTSSPREGATAQWVMDNPDQNPGSDYGVQKRQCRELLHQYADREGFDTRFVIIPGVLHTQPVWGGGTTEYALDALAAAVRGEHYVCPVSPDVKLPMIHSSDLIEGMLKLMQSPPSKFPPNCRGTALAGFSFTPAELFEEIKKHYPDFSYSYDPESNPSIANFSVTWPDSLCHWEAIDRIGFLASTDFPTTVKHIIEAHQERQSCNSDVMN
mmetsp:Transcript_22134/g.32231  ORF Transcript_22134/g.32231 Transcript_22134/m.32231 type:complete len:336 (+) Transcript_22134:92-1099(+)|eukprot:CAMPEP_0185028902 /NCGR_PEP_ID=MMETSP1103-20130426/14971_1 /TAXON_ID=36769 /ORGANISM="Paraphysomonas bandaiensis, Strain Caron Lab Isolate" /LENGTH=335 /DNA_ID=CAMNT_0027563477 /DNA_START=37 /DNA_END=1044 /DNA_ORIENTATION=-